MAKLKTKRLLALLLDAEYRSKSKYELAKKAGCTPSWALMLTKKLEKKGFLEGLKVTNVKGLFEAFHKIRPKKQKIREYSIHSISDIGSLLNIFKKTGREYAFTTYIAENLVQKHLFSHRTDVYVKEDDLQDWHTELTKVGTYGGGNVRLIISTYDELFNKKKIHDELLGGKLFDMEQTRRKKESDGPWIVSIPQLISDLYVEGGPAGEAADMLLEKLVKATGEKK
jgi:DNA-binding Lrp family transcriptional regulator